MYTKVGLWPTKVFGRLNGFDNQFISMETKYVVRGPLIAGGGEVYTL